LTDHTGAGGSVGVREPEQAELVENDVRVIAIVESPRTSGMSGAEGSRIKGCACNATGESSAVFAAQDPSVGSNKTATDSNKHEALFGIVAISP
jgi:hypothetical protein